MIYFFIEQKQLIVIKIKSSYKLEWCVHNFSTCSGFNFCGFNKLHSLKHLFLSYHNIAVLLSIVLYYKVRYLTSLPEYSKHMIKQPSRGIPICEVAEHIVLILPGDIRTEVGFL